MVGRIIEQGKPAHTAFALQPYEELFVVGRARLGLDTELARSLRFTPVVLGQSRSAAATSATHDPSTSPTGWSPTGTASAACLPYEHHPVHRRGEVMTMTETCVSLTTGTISPDQRVNYAYGMVLGVDEFLTEQQHRLEKGHLHERALHGYGTVYGLHVTAAAPDDADDVQVTVSTGMLIDQYGRETVITCAQCARLGAWLAAQEQASPGTVASRPRPVR